MVSEVSIQGKSEWMLLKCFQHPFPPLLTNLQKGCSAFLIKPPFVYALHWVDLPPLLTHKQVLPGILLPCAQVSWLLGPCPEVPPTPASCLRKLLFQTFPGEAYKLETWFSGRCAGRRLELVPKWKGIFYKVANSPHLKVSKQRTGNHFP